jgi:hypothetical protein
MMETLPRSSQDIIIDSKTGEILYWNGKECGYRPVDSLICEKCLDKGCK